MMSALSPTPGPSGPQKARPTGVVIPHRARWYQRIAAFIIVTAIRCVAATIRFQIVDRSGLFHTPSKENVIFAIWHNRLLLSVSIYRRYLMAATPERRMAAMVSASRDGGFLARILELLEVEPVRGSSSRRGPQALREMVSWGERGCDLAITPDGPRGPCYSVQEGVISAAQLTGLRILPVTYNLNWKIRLHSWDRFQIPLPFALCELVAAPLVHVPREATDAERETLRRQLEKTLREISRD